MTDKKASQESGFFQRTSTGIRKNLRETVGELRKVSWPTTQETFNMTRIVIAVILVMGLLLGLLDALFSRFFALLISL